MTHLWKPWGPRRSRFGDTVVIAFLLVQALDGILTYLGVATYGPGVEGNPLVASLMHAMGEATGLVAAKGVAVTLGAILHLGRVHGLVALLTGIYVAAAILPWAALLYF
jgi:hypothetical protein